MQAYNMTSIVNAINAPPGIVHPILTEKWAWVDDSLREAYYGEEYDELNGETFDMETFNRELLNEGFLEEEISLDDVYLDDDVSLDDVSLDEEDENGLFKENWDWVDDRLRELYYGYALNDETFDEYQRDGLLKENWAWVDERLSEKYYEEPVEEEFITQCPLTWMDYRFGVEATHQTLEEMSYIPPILREDPYNPVDCSKLFGLCEHDENSNYVKVSDGESIVDLESSLDLGSNMDYDEFLKGYDSEEFYDNCVKVNIDMDECIEIY
jgi:hypothetical protein